MTTTDSNGIIFLEETDPISPFHTLINTLQQGTSDVVEELKADNPLPFIHIRRGALQARPANAWGVVVYDTSVTNAGDGAWTWTPGSAITLTKAGLYTIHMATCMSISTFASQIVAGGKVVAQTPVGGSSSLVANTCGATVHLNSGDTIAGNVYPTAAANVLADATSAPSFMTVTRLSA